MARHRSDTPEDALDRADDRAGEDLTSDSAEDLDDELTDQLGDEDADDEEDEDEAVTARSASVSRFWEKVKVDPVEIALPRGVGYTLRAYRMSDIFEEEAPEEAGATPAEAEPEAEEPESAGKKGKTAAATSSSRKRVDEDVDDDEDLDDERDDEDLEDELDDDLEDEEAEDEEAEGGDEEEAELEPEEIPVFLTQDRNLLLFRSREGLAEFVRSGEAHDLDVIEEWDDLRSGITAEHIVADEDDRYELDLVVENLRGGHDAWDSELLIKAGELCRDLGHALRIESVIGALSSGSPLDDLDEALRATENGKIGAFFARRKLRRIGAQQAALAWRSIIGKISTSVDWRD